MGLRCAPGMPVAATFPAKTGTCQEDEPVRETEGGSNRGPEAGVSPCLLYAPLPVGPIREVQVT